VETGITITEPEIDTKVFGRPLSIKTITKGGFSGVKISWTVDTQKVQEFKEIYSPRCDILLIRIKWGGVGGFYYIPLEAQERVFGELGANGYIKLPKPGTNPRGVEITKEALTLLVRDEAAKSIEVDWQQTRVSYNPYKRWVDYWRED
jgi:hypothetical protein